MTDSTFDFHEGAASGLPVRRTITHVLIDVPAARGVGNMSLLLREVLLRIFMLDTADSLCAELTRKGFVPLLTQHDGDRLSVRVEDPNLGSLQLHCFQSTVTVH